MCRIFGFRSILESKVHNSLVHAENALEIQSQIHSDGWGVAYYIEQTPHVIKSEKAAIDDRLFKKISGIVRSTTVVAHVRKATEGQNDILNTHPFQYGPWIFVHNGHIKNFDQKKSELLKHIDEQLKSFILGNTDSEILFYFILSKMKKYKNFSKINENFEVLKNVITESIHEIINIIGELSEGCPEIEECRENYLTFILTNGSTMIGYHGGQQLYYSIHKSKCGESASCPFYSSVCENEQISGKVNHLVLSSEPVNGENEWRSLKMGQFIAVDDQMNIHKSWIE